MLCEPILDVPQKGDFKNVQKTEQPFFAAQDASLKAQTRKQLHTETGDYDIFPKSLNSKNEHLTSVLSLRENPFLNCRWNAFLDNKTKMGYPKIRLFADVRHTPVKPRKLSLNGQFYGVDNKLSPIPVMDDPRNSVKSVKATKPPRVHQSDQKKF